jgi:hypothetical protein
MNKRLPLAVPIVPGPPRGSGRGVLDQLKALVVVKRDRGMPRVIHETAHAGRAIFERGGHAA